MLAHLHPLSYFRIVLMSFSLCCGVQFVPKFWLLVLFSLPNWSCFLGCYLKNFRTIRVRDKYITQVHLGRGFRYFKLIWGCLMNFLWVNERHHWKFHNVKKRYIYSQLLKIKDKKYVGWTEICRGQIIT